MYSATEDVLDPYQERRDSPFFQHVNQRRIPDDTFNRSGNVDYQQDVEETLFARPETVASRAHEDVDNSQNALIAIWKAGTARIAPLRALIASTRMDVKQEKYQFYQHEKTYDKILERFMATLNTATADESYTQIHDTLNSLATELRRCRTDWKAFRDRANALEEILTNHERQMHRVEDDMYAHLDDIQRRKTQRDEHQLQSSSAHTALPRVSSSDGDNELLARLYTRIGDTRIYFERLNNFEFDFREEMEERELLRASGQLEATTDAEFFEQTKAEKIKIQRELDLAQEEVENLKKQCRREGILFEEPQAPDMLYHAETESYATTFDPSSQSHNVQPGSSSIIGAFFNAQDRVTRWLRASSGSSSSGKARKQDTPAPQPRRESESTDMGWILTPKRPVSLKTSGKYGSVAQDSPTWSSGPGPGSPLLEALLLDSATIPLGKCVQSSEIPAMRTARQSFAAFGLRRASVDASQHAQG